MPTNTELQDQQRAHWTSAAAGWERWTDYVESRMSEVTAWLADRAGARPGTHLLDLACGGGEPASTLAARVAPGGSVVATDYSAEMVDATRRRAARLGRANLTAQVADAQSLPFDAGSFDAVTCRFGLMFCPEPERAAHEIRRVLGRGRFAVAVWDVPAKNPYYSILARILRRHMEIPPFDPKAPGPFRLAAPGELGALFSSAGFDQLEVESLPLTWGYESAEQAWQFQLDLSAPLREAARTLPPATLEQIRLELFASLDEFTQEGVIELPATALCASGVARS
jgi:SAM-dependent methyltransferase